MVATVASVALVVAWLVIDGELWDRPEDSSCEARERSRLYNISTLVTLTAGVQICYLALYVVNLVWALFVLDPAAWAATSMHRSATATCSYWLGSWRRRQPLAAASAPACSRTRRSARPRTPSARKSAATVSRANGPRPGLAGAYT
jgi:hypothetical protein